MYILYPQNIAVVLSPEHLDTISLQNLNKQLPGECIVHLYGMHYVGLSSVGARLAHLLKATLIDKGLIVSVIAYQILENKKWYDNHIFQPYFEELSFQKNSALLIPIIQGKAISIAALKSNRIEALIRKLLLDDKFIEYLYSYISAALSELAGTRIIIVDNSAVPDYLSESMLGTKKVLNILFTSSLASYRSRYLESRLLEYKHMKSDFEPGSELLQSIEQEFTKQILQKNEELLERVLTGNEGIIAQNSYMLNISSISVETATGTVLKAMEFAYIV